MWMGLLGTRAMQVLSTAILQARGRLHLGRWKQALGEENRKNEYSLKKLSWIEVRAVIQVVTFYNYVSLPKRT